MKGYSYKELQEETAQLEWEAEQERKSENMMLGIYETGVTQYDNINVRWDW